MMRNAYPDLNIDRAAIAVRARPAPVYWKLLLRYDLSEKERASRVSRLKIASTTTTTPATPAAVMPNLCQEIP
jgi:hypothetical protein